MARCHRVEIRSLLVKSASLAGRKIGRYEMVGLLATGGMAEIFLAKQLGPSGFCLW